MAATDSRSVIGTWFWDEEHECLAYSGKETVIHRTSGKQSSSVSASLTISDSGLTPIRFKETINPLEQMYYRKMFQRRIKITDPEVVTVQDLKDIVIYMINPQDLTKELILYLHTPTMDRFLRALIVYFVYFVQVAESMDEKRPIAARMLRNEAAERNERITSENFADLRSVLAKEYACILMGIGDMQVFHHMNNNKNNTSLSGRDKRLFESLVAIACKVVWIALQRQYLSLIEGEVSRLLRSDLFNIIERQQFRSKLLPNEKKIIFGSSYKNLRKLFQMSPIVQEITNVDHDYRLLAIGVSTIDPSDPRQLYLEAVFAAPEELLQKLGIGLGILGWPRNNLDTMLKKLPKTALSSPSFSFSNLPIFDLPSKEQRFEDIDTKTLKISTPFKFKETELFKQDRESQLNIWLKYLKMNHTKSSRH